MKKQASVQYTIRGIPPEVDHALRKRAAQKKISLNQLVVDELSSVAEKPRRRTDFSKYVGTWEPDPEFDEIIAFQRQIDWDKWK